MFGISLKIEGDRKAFADLSRFLKVVDKPFLDKRLVKDLQREFFSGEKEQFKSEGGFGSGGWADLSPKYEAWKRKHYPGKKILERKSKLKKSLTRSGSGTILQVEKNGRQLSMGSTVKYAKYHQNKRGRKHLPRRAPIEFPKKQNIAFEKVVQKAIIKQAKDKMRTTWEVRAGV